MLFLFRTTNLDIFEKHELADEDVEEFNSIAENINKLQSVKKKKVIFLICLARNYGGLKTVREIGFLGKVNVENVNFSDEENE